MPDLGRVPPIRRPDLVLSPLGNGGQYVVKDRRTGAFYTLGPEEAFLLERLDGQQSVGAICAAFEQRFGTPLGEADLDGFQGLARQQGFLQPEAPLSGLEPGSPEEQLPGLTPPGSPAPRRRWWTQSLLYWRASFFDPDRFFNRLEPRIRFVWTRGFALLSGLAIVAAALLLWGNWRELLTDLPGALRWETVALAWLTLVVVTFCHEFAHGLTCKHYGGEVHEVGFLLMFFMPCFYCNVSDAWLFKEKSKRLLVTLAGGYCDLCLWALAVFAWRLTPPQTLPHYLAYVVLTVCGGRIFLNFNPFLRLDGYYLLSDWAEIPNLRQRSWDRLTGWVRTLLWGAARPAPDARGCFLLVYGSLSWGMSVAYLALGLVALVGMLGTEWGPVGVALTALLGVYFLRSMFRGFTGGEFVKMLLLRHVRTALWVVAAGAVPAVLLFGVWEDRPGGSFSVRPDGRAELRARVSGFLRAVYCDEGDRVGPASVVAHLEIPDLSSRTAQKKAELRETKAKLRLLEAGARPEELKEQRARVARARDWRDLAQRDLARGKVALREDLARLDRLLAQNQAELDYAAYALKRDERLYRKDVLPRDQYEDRKKNHEVRLAQLAQTRAERRAREAKGVIEAEAELARREKELADAISALALLEAGTRPEEIEAERARLARLEEELRFLEGQRDRLPVLSPVGGVVATPHLKEKVGQFLKEGDLICMIERTETLEVEVVLDEQVVGRVEEGQAVELKARAFPLQSFHATVSRIAPVAHQPATDPTRHPAPDTPGSITVYCAVEDGTGLRPGMTGYARISSGRRTIGAIVLERALRLLRTEYWW
jgi:multidrug efflux pump subunit AcrA (membrane-fusion protein)